MKDIYDLDSLDRELMVKVHKAVEYALNGDPYTDVLDYEDVCEALELLSSIVKLGYAK